MVNNSRMEEIKRSNELAWSEGHDNLAETMENLNKLREEHARDLEMMYDMHARDYEREALDRYLSRDDTQYLAKAENNPVLVKSYSKLDVRVWAVLCFVL
jgi:hypothetical protein